MGAIVNTIVTALAAKEGEKRASGSEGSIGRLVDDSGKAAETLAVRPLGELTGVKAGIRDFTNTKEREKMGEIKQQQEAALGVATEEEKKRKIAEAKQGEEAALGVARLGLSRNQYGAGRRSNLFSPTIGTTGGGRKRLLGQ